MAHLFETIAMGASSIGAGSLLIAQVVTPSVAAATCPEIDLSPATIGAIGATAVVVIGAFAAGVVTIITAVRSVGGKADVIVGHVNSEKTAGEGRETTLKAENALLREMLAKQDTAAALLAQADLLKTRGSAPADVAPSPKAEASLQQIDANTAATAENTKET